MSHPHRSRATLAGIIALIMMGLLALPSLAAQPPLASGAWVRAIEGMDMTAAYVTLENPTAQPDTLLSAQAKGVGSVSLHQTDVRDGIAHMSEARDGITLPAHGKLVFAPGGRHLMLEGVKSPLKPGQKLVIILDFKRAGQVPVTFTVQSNPPGSSHDMAGMKM